MFVNIIGKAMNKKGLSVEEAAKKVGVKPTQIVSWMKEYEIPSSHYMARISKELDIPLCMLSDYYSR